MDDSTIENQRVAALALWLTAFLAELCWVVFPVMRRAATLSLTDWIFISVAPIAFVIGRHLRRLGILLLAVPFAWLAVLPFAPRDGLGFSEVFGMAVSLVAYLISVATLSRHRWLSHNSVEIIWTAKHEDRVGPPESRIVPWVIPGCLIVSVCAVLAWPSLQHDLSQYSAGVAARLQVAFIFVLGCFGGAFTFRLGRVRMGWTQRSATAFFGGLAMVSAVLFTLWRLV